MQENREHSDPAGILGTLFRGARMRCPKCGKGGLYQQWNVFNNHCDTCRYEFEDREGDCWFFLYSTTAALTGLFIIIMLLWRPEHIVLGRTLLGIGSACVITLSLPVRKGIALALEHLAESKGENLLFYDDSHRKDSK